MLKEKSDLQNLCVIYTIYSTYTSIQLTCRYLWALKACLEGLAGERSYSYTLDPRPILSSSWEGRPLRPSAQLRVGRA